MSTQITTAFVQQYSANVMMLAQQKGSKLKDLVRNETVNGKQAFFDQIGATAARRRTNRHSDTPRMDTPHARRRCALEDFDWADLVDNEDKIRMLIDPTSSYAMAAAMAMGRAMDEVIIDAMRGTAFAGETGSTSIVLPAGSKVAVAASGLTLTKLLAAKSIMDGADIDSEGRYIAVTNRQLTDLLNVTEVKNADFNSVKALAQGEMNSFLGFNFIRVDGLRIDGTRIMPFVTGSDRAVMAWQRDNVVLGVGATPQAKISERGDKNYATQVFFSMSIGAVRMQEAAVVEVSALES
jgi:hypothetical protein